MLTVDYNLLDVRKGDMILDAGCGDGRHSFECIARGASVCSMDIDIESLKKTSYVLNYMKEIGDAHKDSRFQVHIGDALRLPFREETFDRIICSEVMEHVSDDNLACSELVRTLKKGGRIAITVPTYFSEAIYGLLTDEYFTSPGGHIRKYLPGKLAKIMRSNNLEIYNIRFRHSFHFIYWMIRCVVGLHLEDHLITKRFRNFLKTSWESKYLRKVESFFDMFFPKSIILYAIKR
ncbi:MAG: class I SAM-dependent methyltransferase [Spirochaetota bacterium]|nr:class I SAM-dependent methyltransferase [Spirochaetota bacterium]